MATRNSIRAPASFRAEARSTVVEPAWPSPDGRTLVFVHGWPDTVDMWTPLIERLSKQGHKCVCVPLPWYPGGSDPEKRPDFDTAARDVAQAARLEKKKVTLVCHDWGCVVGFKVQKLAPELVAAIVALDVGGDARGLSSKEKAFIFSYQAWLVAAHLVGGPVGDYMTTRFARLAGAPITRNEDGSVSTAVVRARLNWPYVAFWRDALFPRAPSARDERVSQSETRKTPKTPRDSKTPPFAPSCPVLFLFGGNKPARFHGDAWLAAIDAKNARGDASAWREIKNAGHWFATERADETFEALDRWFRETKKFVSDETSSEGGAEGGRLRSAL